MNRLALAVVVVACGGEPEIAPPTFEPPDPVSTHASQLARPATVVVPAGPSISAPLRCPKPADPPDHVFRLQPFAVDATTTSCADYSLCVDAGVCPEIEKDKHCDFVQHRILVDHRSAAIYCAWRSARLPTYAEWEKAIRVDGRVTPWRDGAQPACHHECTYTSAYGVSYIIYSPLDGEWLADVDCENGHLEPVATRMMFERLDDTTTLAKRNQIRCVSDLATP